VGAGFHRRKQSEKIFYNLLTIMAGIAPGATFFGFYFLNRKPSPTICDIYITQVPM